MQIWVSETTTLLNVQENESNIHFIELLMTVFLMKQNMVQRSVICAWYGWI